MAKVTASGRKQNRIDLQNISERDRDILSLDTPTTMKKYKLDKQAVYDRRFALNKKIKAAGVTIEQVLNGTGQTEESPEVTPKKRGPKKRQTSKPIAEKVEEPTEEAPQASREVMLVDKHIPVIMKPIEINFDSCSVRLNGVPKKISINPDTHAIEIDL